MSQAKLQEGSTRTPAEEFTRPLRSVLRWMLSLRNGAGVIVCPDHGIAHTGKNAGVIVMACELARLESESERDELFTVAREQALILVQSLEREGESTCFTFRPGRHDPYNCSNNVIDGGACCDALAEFLHTFGERLAADERAAITRAAVLHAQTYLRYCILDKGIPAQRAWAMSGVANAWSLCKHDVLELALDEGIQLLGSAQHADGSYPYHPLEAGAGHVGASDVSSFYQSRVTAFLMFSLERMGRDPAEEPYSSALRSGLDFLVGLQGPDGIKCGLVEAKPWYWGANYEVASHPFDIYALARGAQHFGDARYAQAALRAMRAWTAHLSADGQPMSHSPGPGRKRSFQCPVFWAGHCSWLARSIHDLTLLASSESPQAVTLPRVTHFADASLVRLEDEAVVAWVRGRRPGFNPLHGSPHGAGLLRVWSKKEGRELLTRCRLAGVNEGEWSGSLGSFSTARGWRAAKTDVRLSTWIARNDWRGGRWRDALLATPRSVQAGLLAFGSSRVGSAFEREPQLELVEDGVRLVSRLARRDGESLGDTRLERTFRVDGCGLVVEETMHSAGAVRNLTYHPPAAASSLEQSGRPTGERVSYRLG